MLFRRPEKIKGGGQIRTFIDDPSPNIIEIPKTHLRYLKIRFIEAFWEGIIPDERLILFNEN